MTSWTKIKIAGKFHSAKSDMTPGAKTTVHKRTFGYSSCLHCLKWVCPIKRVSCLTLLQTVTLTVLVAHSRIYADSITQDRHNCFALLNRLSVNTLAIKELVYFKLNSILNLKRSFSGTKVGFFSAVLESFTFVLHRIGVLKTSEEAPYMIQTWAKSSPIGRKQSYNKELYLNTDSFTIYRCQVLRLIDNIKGFHF